MRKLPPGALLEMSAARRGADGAPYWSATERAAAAAALPFAGLATKRVERCKH